jgi:hypothetical protein
MHALVLKEFQKPYNKNIRNGPKRLYKKIFIQHTWISRDEINQNKVQCRLDQHQIACMYRYDAYNPLNEDNLSEARAFLVAEHDGTPTIMSNNFTHLLYQPN